MFVYFCFFFNDTATTEIYTLSLHDALPIYQLTKAQNRIHLLEGLLVALNNIDSIITLIRESQSVDNARSALMTWYKLDELQAQAILDMPLRRLAALERDRKSTRLNSSHW